MSQAPSANEKRRQRRQKSKRATKVFCTRGLMRLGPNLARTLLDLSATGAALVVMVSFQPGEDLVLELDITWRARPLQVPARVIWCVPTSNAHYCIGVKLERPLDHRDLSDFASS
jgi:hypothetical protein